ncbi:MAG: Na/Pi cotransporter family protein [Clostridiales bacterium]|nr:Na/Pi cotransporter family protein [Clostridiales bacterium]
MSFNDILTLLGGLGLFLFGMRVMGEGLERAAGPKLKHVLSLMTKNKVIAMATGMFVTAIIQSSGATTVMVVGFVNAQLLSMAQAVGVIMGANIGTTMTSLLLSIKFDPGAVFIFIGILMIMAFSKKETLKQAGFVSMGLGILFIGMDLMKDAMTVLKDLPVFQELMLSVKNPVLGVLIGAGITALLQSSSVSVGILQVLAEAGEGKLPMEGALFILLGANIGSCVPSLLSMANSSVAAKRTALIHLLFNIVGTTFILIATCFLPLATWAETLVPDSPKLCISMMHISFNVICTLILLPGSGLLVKLSGLLVRGKDEETKTLKMQYFDQRLIKTPSLAAEQLYREVCRMGREAHNHISLAVDALRNMDLTHEKEIQYHEELSDYLEEAITEGLVAVMPLELNEHENRRIAALFHMVTDIERISDHADNIYELAKERVNRDAKLSDKAKEEIDLLFERVTRVLNTALEGLEEWGITDSVMRLLEAEEQNVDDMTEGLRHKHIERLKEHKCTPKSGVIFLEAINNMERVADHAMNIACSAREESFHNHLLDAQLIKKV